MPKHKIKINDWVRVRKVGIQGMYQVKEIRGEEVIVEQDEDGYKHKMKLMIEELSK